MFESRKQNYTVESLRTVDDSFNYVKPIYVSEGLARIYIVVQDRTLAKNNDLNLYNETLVGYTNDKRINKNWRIDGKYIVTSTMPHRDENILYLKDCTNGK